MQDLQVNTRAFIYAFEHLGFSLRDLYVKVSDLGRSKCPVIRRFKDSCGLPLKKYTKNIFATVAVLD